MFSVIQFLPNKKLTSISINTASKIRGNLYFINKSYKLLLQAFEDFSISRDNRIP